MGDWLTEVPTTHTHTHTHTHTQARARTHNIDLDTTYSSAFPSYRFSSNITSRASSTKLCSQLYTHVAERARKRSQATKREQPAPSTHAHLQPLQLVPTAQRGSGQPAGVSSYKEEKGEKKHRQTRSHSPPQATPNAGVPALSAPLPPLAPSTRVSCVAKSGPLSSEESNKLAGKDTDYKGAGLV